MKNPKHFTWSPVLLLVLFLLTGGCDATDAVDPDIDPGSSVAAKTNADLPPSQMRELEALKNAWDAAWAAYDAEAYASYYAEDADFVNPLGGILSGRGAIRGQHEFLFSGPFAGSTSSSAFRRVTFLTGTTAMVDLDVMLTGYAFLPPGLPEVEPGVVRTRMKWIAGKREATWQILAQQITAVQPAP